MGDKDWVGKNKNMEETSWRDWLWALSLEQPPWKLGSHRSPLDPLKMGVCPDATPGTFIHDPSAEKVLQSLIQAGGHPILLTCARYWHL